MIRPRGYNKGGHPLARTYWDTLFPAVLTGYSDGLYGFQELMCNTDGTYSVHPSGRSGSAYDGSVGSGAREINDHFVPDGTYVWLRQRGLWDGNILYEFQCCGGSESSVYVETIGNGTDTVYLITHNLGTPNIVPILREVSTGELTTYATVKVIDNNTVSVTFASPPSNDQYTLILGTPGGTPEAAVTGPGSSTDNAISRWDGTDGTDLQSSAVTLSDAGAMSGVLSIIAAPGNELTITGGTISGDELTLQGSSHADGGTVVTTVTTALTATAFYPDVVRHLTTGTATTGFAVGTSYVAQNASGTRVEVGRSTYVYTDATNASEDSSWFVSVVTGGAVTEGLRVVSPGVIRLPESSTPSTPASGYAVMWFDTSGNLNVTNDAGTTTNLTGLARTEGTVTAAGSTQGDAQSFTADAVVVSGADGTKGIILPDREGAIIAVWNSSASTLKVYPPSGAAIETNATNAADLLVGTSSRSYKRVSATQWINS